MDWTAVAVAMITGMSLVGAASIPAHIANKKTRRAVEAVHTEVKTNHGKSAYQYLEMIADVREMVESNRQDQREIVQLIADHTQQDAINFERLRGDMAMMHAKGTTTP